jgi:hypothetical protein
LSAAAISILLAAPEDTNLLIDKDHFRYSSINEKTLFDNSKPIETDEAHKVMHEGYALNLIGQSDMNRMWHVS